MYLRVSYKKKYEKCVFFFILKVTVERSRIRIRRSVSRRYGSADPDPHQHITDPQHWMLLVPMSAGVGMGRPQRSATWRAR